MTYCQCQVVRGDESLVAFIEAKGAKVGAIVEIFEKPGEPWKIVAVLSRPLNINEVFKGPPYDPPIS